MRNAIAAAGLLALLLAGCGAAAVPVTDVQEFNPSHFFMKIEWHGFPPKPLPRAGLATEVGSRELEKWRGMNEPYKKISVISQPEVLSLEALLMREPFTHMRVSSEWDLHEGQLVMRINTGGLDYFYELGCEQKTLRLLEKISEQLRFEHRRPVDLLIPAMTSLVIVRKPEETRIPHKRIDDYFEEEQRRINEKHERTKERIEKEREKDPP
ncbi:MAG: hypothetical protein ACYTAF_06485 [Planctomycetota bacterium]